MDGADGTALMWQEILDQPGLVTAQLARLREEARRTFDDGSTARGTVYLVGTGDSYIAARSSLYLWAHYTGRWPQAWPTREFTSYCPVSRDDTAIIISTTGSAAATTAAARAVEQGATMLALTALPDGSLARTCGRYLELPAPWTRQTPHTRDYMATLLALACLVERYAGTALIHLDEIGVVLNETIHMARATVKRLSAIGTGMTYFLGAGPLWPTAEYGAAKFWEAGGLPALGLELEEAAHGLHLAVSTGDTVVIIANNGPHIDLARRLAEGFETLGATPVLVTDADTTLPDYPYILYPSVPDQWSHFVASVPLQVLCHHVAVRQGFDVARSRGGRDPDGLYETVRTAWLASGTT